MPKLRLLPSIATRVRAAASPEATRLWLRRMAASTALKVSVSASVALAAGVGGRPPSWIADVAPTASFGLLLACVSLLLQLHPRTGRWGRWAGLGVAAVAVVAAVLDGRVLLTGATPGAPAAGSLGLGLLAVALLCVYGKSEAAWRVGIGCLGLEASLMFLSLLAVLFGARPETVPLLLRVPWPVAASFLALSGAIAASRPERSIVGIIFSPAAGGRTLRRRLPLGIAVVVAVGYVRVAGERLGWYDTSFGAALMVCAAVSYLWFVVLSGARAFERADRERRQAHDQAVREHARIEAMAAELRHAVEARDRSLMQLEAIIGNMREGLVVVDPHATVLTMNPAALSIFGYGSIEETRQSFTEFAETARVCDAAGEPLAFSQWPIVRVVRGETFTGSEVEMLRADGATFVGSFSGAPVRDKAGVLIFGIITVRDVTEQKRAEQALRAAIETRDNFLSIASHELKTPLTSLKLQTALGKRALRKGEPSFCAPERLGKHLEDTDRQVDRLSRLVEDMLDVSRIEAGKLCLTYEAVDLRGLVRDVAERLRPDLTSGAYDLAIDASGPVVGHWDHYRIEQVVVNLLTNAMKYGAGKPIRVSVLREGEVARLVVRDQGIGIPRDKHEAIFGRFERAVSRNEVSGLGLGLYIVRHIVQQHQGLVYVESEPARGATFTVELPLETVASA